MSDELVSGDRARRKWERFEAKGDGPRRGKLRVSISRRGTIQINAAAMEMLGNPRATALYFERASGAIGVESRRLDEPNTFRVRAHSARGYGRIAALAFLRKYGLTVQATVAAPVEIESGILVIEIFGSDMFKERYAKNLL
ncbi:MAG: hypothetical protein ABI999_07580 [Acidobacteriota bacterium]